MHVRTLQPLRQISLAALGAGFALFGWAGMARGEDPKPAAPQASAVPADAHPALKKLAELIGGRWVTHFKKPDGTPVGEFRYTWESGTLRSRGTLGRSVVEAVFGWDPIVKKPYFVDLHGPETVYFGHFGLEGEDLVFDFKSLVGRPSVYRSREKLI